MKIFAILASLILNLSVINGMNVQADRILPFIEDFESYKVGKVDGKFDDWEVRKHGGSVTASIVEGAKGANGKCLKIEDTGGDWIEAESGWEPPSPKKLIVEYRLMVSKLPEVISAMLYVSPPAAIAGPNWAEGGVCVALDNDKLVYHGGAWLDVRKINANQWYTLKFDIDIPARKFDVYVDEKKEVDGSPFRGGTADKDTLTRIWIETSSAPSLTAFYDDIFAYDKTGPDPHAIHPSGKLPLTWGRIKVGY